MIKNKQILQYIEQNLEDLVEQLGFLREEEFPAEQTQDKDNVYSEMIKKVLFTLTVCLNGGF